MLCAIVLSVIMQSVEHYNAKYFYAECDLTLPGMFFVKCHYAKFYYAKCHHVECQKAECQ
jgi:hypothetical protein